MYIGTVSSGATGHFYKTMIGKLSFSFISLTTTDKRRALVPLPLTVSVVKIRILRAVLTATVMVYAMIGKRKGRILI